MTDHEPFQREPQNPQDPQVVVFSPELLKLADRRRQALEDCRQAAEDGDANAVVQMGMNCLYGIGGAAKDPEKAFRWFSQTAPDDPAGLYWLGVCYDNGFDCVFEIRNKHIGFVPLIIHRKTKLYAL